MRGGYIRRPAPGAVKAAVQHAQQKASHWKRNTLAALATAAALAGAYKAGTSPRGRAALSSADMKLGSLYGSKF